MIVDFLKQHAPGDIKMTLPTVNQFPAIAYKKGVSDKAYPTRSEFLWDIVPMVKAEIRALIDEGVKYIQLDAPRYSYYIDPKWRRHIREEMGLDPEQALDEAIRADNACLEGAKRDGVILPMHLCRGNNRISGSVASTRRAATCRWRTSLSARSAGSPRRWKATC